MDKEEEAGLDQDDAESEGRGWGGLGAVDTGSHRAPNPGF